MIKVNLTVVGKVRESYIADGIEEYKKRLKKYCEFTITEIKEEDLASESEAEIKRALKAEGSAILKKVKGEYYVFAIEGKSLSSEKFAEFFSTRINEGKEIELVIGSSYGLDDAVKNGAKGRISLSEATFPHALFRLIACEQIYRAFTIINGSAYHK